jgi:hypothetical protein
MNNDDPPERHSLPVGAIASDPPAWRWIFLLTHYGCGDGWRPTCKILLLLGIPLALLIVLSLVTGPWWALGTGTIVGGATWLRRRAARHVQQLSRAG